MTFKIKKWSHKIQLLATFLLTLAIIMIRPLSMDLNQSIILATLIMVIIIWTTGIVKKTYASIFLLIVFSIFGRTNLGIIFKFPLSSNFYLIALSFLLSQGIVNSKFAARLSNLVIYKYGNSPTKVILLSFVFSVFLIFIIPQSFSRVILLSSIFSEFFREKRLQKKEAEIFYFSIFVSTAFTSMLFLNGDIILNYSATQFAGITLSWFEWFKYMTLPSVFTVMLVITCLLVMFKKRIKNIRFESCKDSINSIQISKQEKSAMIIMGLVILFWMTEPLHSINPTYIALIGTVAMFLFKILDTKDLLSLNFDLLIFLTAALSIGSVLNQSGVANIIYSKIMFLFPATYSNMYLLVLIFTVMVLHMILGSSITTMSVVIPILVELTRGILNPVVVSLLVYLSVNMHFLLPFHHILIMVGSGKNFYTNKTVLQFGLLLTVLVFIVIFSFYLPWWRYIKLI